MWILGAMVGAALFAACDEKKGDGGGGTSSSASATTSAAATNSATASASASVAKDDDDDDTAGVPSTTASGSASAKPTASATAGTKPTGTNAVASASAGPAPGSCGGKDQPKCPLQAWMAGNMQPAMASGDGPKIAAALRASAKLAPPGYGDWSKLANDGAAAVDAAKDPDSVAAAAKAACKSCHGVYQKRYRTEMRERPI
jgi:hypothetical protein